MKLGLLRIELLLEPPPEEEVSMGSVVSMLLFCSTAMAAAQTLDKTSSPLLLLAVESVLLFKDSECWLLSTDITWNKKKPMKLIIQTIPFHRLAKLAW